MLVGDLLIVEVEVELSVGHLLIAVNKNWKNSLTRTVRGLPENS